MQVPTVMVSSTFYDLKQHRVDLQLFLQDELGYRPLLSEHPSFPINPDLSTIANCRERVERDADVLVLVVGRRYGSLDDHSAKSVTNLEYLAAREKGIPIYAFLERGISALLPVWRANPGADFSKEVDSIELFKFVEVVRSSDRVWVHEFDHAQEIIEALRVQFAYQHREGLLLAARFKGVRGQLWLDRLAGDTLRVALEQPPAWECRLFAGALTDAIARQSRLRRRHELAIPLGLGEDVDDPIRWFQARFQDATRLAAGLSDLINGELQHAFGLPGIPGDRERIVFVAETVGELYEDALRWADRLRTANIDANFAPVLKPVARLLDDAIDQIERFGPAVQASLEAALEAKKKTGDKQVVELTLTVTVPADAIEEFQAELLAAASRAGVD